KDKRSREELLALISSDKQDRAGAVKGMAAEEESLAELRARERRVLKDGYGPDHPKVRAGRKEVEILTARVMETSKEAETSPGQWALARLRIQEALLRDEGYGQDHPKVRAVCKEMEVLAAQLKGGFKAARSADEEALARLQAQEALLLEEGYGPDHPRVR